VSLSPSSSSPAGNLKNVTPEALGPAARIDQRGLSNTSAYLVAATRREVGCARELTAHPLQYVSFL